MNWKKICNVLLTSVIVAVLCCGCAHTSDGLYALPKQSDSYYDLQEAIRRVMSPGTTYAGPQSGANQQPVQLANLDDDADEEAIAFLKTIGELPLKAYIFDKQGESYVNLAVIEGEGSSFDCVEYAQLDGLPGMEIILGRRLSDQILQSLTAYSCTNGKMEELLTCNYSEFQLVDLDRDQRKDVFVLRLETDERAGVAEMYAWRDNQIERLPEATMSVGAKQIKRIITGGLEEEVPAVFVASTYEEDTIVTDIFTFGDDRLHNITTGDELIVSAQTVRNYNVYATDIDKDGVIELPLPVVLPSNSAAEETHWAIDWYSMTADGSHKIKMSTYHNYSGGWYLELPVQWRDQITVSRDTELLGVTAYSISHWRGYDKRPQPIVTIYAFTGEDRLERATSEGRFLLAEKGETAYAAAFGSGDWAKALTQEEMGAMFHFIFADWNTGET